MLIKAQRMIMVLTILYLMVSCNAPVTEPPLSPTKTLEVNLSNASEEPAPTPTIGVLPTGTEALILPPTQVAEIIRELYLNNGGCELPCLWGIDPGKSAIQDVYDQFSQIGSFRDITRSVDALQVITFTTSPPSELNSVYDDDRWSFHIRVENNVVVGLLSGVTVIDEFSNPALATFLTYFGQPEGIWIRVIESMPRSDNPDYVIVLYYPSKGTFISWRGEAASIVVKTEESITVTACPQYIPTEADTVEGSYPPFFYFFLPNENISFDEIINKHLSEDPGGPYQLLDVANTEDFYMMYLSPTTEECFPFSYTFTS